MRLLWCGGVLLAGVWACAQEPSQRSASGLMGETAVAETTSRIPCNDAQELMVRVVFPNGTIEATDHRDTLCARATFSVAEVDGRLSLFAEDAEAVGAVMKAVAAYENPDDIDPLWMGLVDLYNGRVQARGIPMQRQQRDVIDIYAGDRVIADVDCRRRRCIEAR